MSNRRLEITRTKKPREQVILLPAGKSEAQDNYLREIKKNIITFVHGPPGSGKAQPLDSTVYTPNGPVLMGQIKVGSEVCTPDGYSAKVVGVYPQGYIDVCKITFTNGDSVECCRNHLWLVDSTHDGWKNRVVDTNYLLNNFERAEHNKYSINLTNPVYFNEQPLPIKPYLFGALLGDANFTHTTIKFSNTDKQCVDTVYSELKEGYILKKAKDKFDYRIVKKERNNKSNYYTESIKDLGLFGKCSHEKSIPKIYLFNSIKNRFALLRGLMDTDGTVDKRGTCSFCTTSQQLAIDFKFLVESLGGLCKIIQKQTTYTYKNQKKQGKLAYNCFVRFNDENMIFSLDRKKNLVRKRTKYFPKRIIESIEVIGEKQCQCIMIDHPDHLYLTNNFIVTHNTFLATLYGLSEFLRGNYEKIILTRPYIEACGEKIGYLPGGIDSKFLPIMMPIMDILEEKMDKETIERLMKNKQIMTIPLGHLRGVTFKKAFVILDESQSATPEQMHLFLTRIGEKSKVVITGDLNQSDLRGINGLSDAIKRLEGIEGIGMVKLDRASIVRHPLIAAIEERYGMLDDY